tara:strand:- start:30 stop:650 length:621 start_codon:yes stop_codon:yes gene_type:complete
MKMKKQEILDGAVGKLDPGSRGTTTVKFKSDLIDYFMDKNLNSILELGTWGGHTTRILSYLFKKVITVDIPKDFERRILGPGQAADINKDRDNITYTPLDLYHDVWNFEQQDAVFIDAQHTYDTCRLDISNSLKLLSIGGYLVFDDFSNPMDNYGVRRIVNHYIESGVLVADKFIGEEDTTSFFSHTVPVHQLGAIPEGVICEIIT